MKIGEIGLGYVGLLVCNFLRCGKLFMDLI